MEQKRQKCEIYTRVVGFLSPLSQWNPGKKAEFADRKTYDRQLKNESDGETELKNEISC